MLGLQRALSVLYPDQCPLCDTLLADPGGLCGTCWSQTPFLRGLVCDSCGVSLPGASDGTAVCDDCLAAPKPWDSGRAALAYRDQGRRIVLSLKHGDRLDLALPAAEWMVQAGRDFLTETTLLVPIPVHWTRLLTRRYNQAVELTRAMSNASGLAQCPDALVRVRRTATQDGMSAEARRHNMAGALAVNPKHAARLMGARVCLVDDVMTSGATMSAATEVLRDAGAAQVFVLLLARVEKTP